jgi:hypothetical protein
MMCPAIQQRQRLQNQSVSSRASAEALVLSQLQHRYQLVAAEPMRTLPTAAACVSAAWNSNTLLTCQTAA